MQIIEIYSRTKRKYLLRTDINLSKYDIIKVFNTKLLRRYKNILITKKYYYVMKYN